MTQDGTIRAIELAAETLFLCSQPGEGLGVREIARQLDASKSTIQRVTTTLRNSGLLAFDESTQRYSLGTAVLRLAAAFPKNDDTILLCREAMGSLWRSVQETVCLHLLVNGKRLTIFQYESPHDLKYSVAIGKPYPLLAGASGRALLSQISREHAESIIATEIALLPPDERPAEALAALNKDLETVELEGYSVSRGEHTPGAVGIAAPLGLPERFPAAALSIYGPESRLTDEAVAKYLPILLDVVANISKAAATSTPLIPVKSN